MSRKNRALAGKAEKARRQRIEFGKIEASKPLNQIHFTLAAANAKRAEIEPLIAYGFFRRATQYPAGKPLNPVGKARREFDGRTYGNFKPRRGAALQADCYATGAVLIRAGKVVGQA